MAEKLPSIMSTDPSSRGARKKSPLAVTHPSKSRDWSASNDLRPDQVTAGSKMKVWWTPPCGHEFDMSIKNYVIANQGCPFCSNRRLLAGYNDLASRCPSIAKEWSTKNQDPPDTYFPNSRQKVTWECDHCHLEWEATIVQRTSRQTGCPHCSTRKTTSNKGSILNQHPDLAMEWRDTADIEEFTEGSDYIAKWECPQGHSWKARIRKRTLDGQGCPTCSGKQVVKGINDLKSQFPEIAKEWHPDNSMLPDQVHAKSSLMAQWVGRCGHQWRAKISNRTSKGSDCPVCSGKIVLKGVNDLASVNPSLVLEWGTRNSIDPTSVTSESPLSVWWCCANGHEWRATIKDRKRFGCPRCSHSISNQEDEISEFLTSHEIPHERSTRQVIAPKELDIWIPDQNIAIEFNGLYWHSEDRVGKWHHANKTTMCAEQGIALIHLWEDDWRDRREVVKRMLLHKLKRSNQPKIAARTTTVGNISGLRAKEFLEENHIQGAVSGTYYLGLVHDDNVIAVMVLRKERNNLIVARYATSCIVVGGFQKLISYVEKRFIYTQLIIFADRTVSQGALYERSGWKQESIIPPDYYYVVNGRRVHKFAYRKNRFRSDTTLVYDPSLTEAELARLNHLPRIYDSGKIKYTKIHPLHGRLGEDNAKEDC